MCLWWQGPSRDTGEHIQAQIGGDTIQPGPVRSRVREGCPFLPCPQQGLLHQVFGVMERAQHLIAMHKQFTTIRSHKSIESHLIARLSGEHQCGLGWSFHESVPLFSRVIRFLSICPAVLLESVAIEVRLLGKFQHVPPVREPIDKGHTPATCGTLLVTNRSSSPSC